MNSFIKMTPAQAEATASLLTPQPEPAAVPVPTQRPWVWTVPGQALEPASTSRAGIWHSQHNAHLTSDHPVQVAATALAHPAPWAAAGASWGGRAAH